MSSSLDNVDEFRMPISAQEQLEQGSIWVKILLWGDSGSGKTHASATIGTDEKRVIICSAESQGTVSVLNSNPNAMVYKVDKLKDVYDFVKLAKSGVFKEKFNTDAIVFDSLTEIQRMMADDIKGDADTLTLPQYNILNERMKKFCRWIRNIEYHVVAIALADHKMDDGKVRVQPMFIGGKTANTIAQYFNLVAYMSKQMVNGDDGMKLAFKSVLETTSEYITKGAVQLAAVETPNLRNWVEKILSQQEDSSDSKIEEVEKNVTKINTKRRRRAR